VPLPAYRLPQPLIHDLPEAQFYERVREFCGAPAGVFENRKLTSCSSRHCAPT